MSRTITNRILLRLVAQANEADIYGDITIADKITAQIQKCSFDIRADDAKYEYSKGELEEDLQKLFWEAAVRIFDYYDETPDLREVQDAIDSELESFVNSIESFISKDVGAYEPKMPGEIIEEDLIEEPMFQLEEEEDTDEEEIEDETDEEDKE